MFSSRFLLLTRPDRHALLCSLDVLLQTTAVGPDWPGAAVKELWAIYTRRHGLPETK